MQLNVPPDLETPINKRLSSGSYGSVEDVLRRALEAQDAEESWTDEEFLPGRISNLDPRATETHRPATASHDSCRRQREEKCPHYGNSNHCIGNP